MGAEHKYGIIGGGNMGEALIKGVLKSGLAKPEEISFFEPTPDRRSYILDEYSIHAASSNTELVDGSQTIILAVKPQVMDVVLSEIGSSVTMDHLVVSIAAGVRIEDMESKLASGVPVIRSMPNTPALVLASATAMAAGNHATDEHLAKAREIFESVGVAIVVDEKQMDVVTGLSGSGPAYVFLMIEAMADAGVLRGLSRQEAILLAEQTLYGAALLALESKTHPAQLKDMVTSPGGTTIAGLKALEDGGFRDLIMEAINAATERSIELGKKTG